MHKKFVCMGLIILICSLFSACHSAEEIPFTELMIRLSRDDSDGIFDTEKSYELENERYLFIPDDISPMLLYTEENTEGILEKVSLSIKNQGQSDCGRFFSYIEKITFAFVPDIPPGTIPYIYNDKIFKDYALFSEYKTYKLTFVSTVYGMSYIIEYT